MEASPLPGRHSSLAAGLWISLAAAFELPYCPPSGAGRMTLALRRAARPHQAWGKAAGLLDSRVLALPRLPSLPSAEMTLLWPSATCHWPQEVAHG